jgi:tetratricopeptide (TPR) repeat protein
MYKPTIEQNGHPRKQRPSKERPGTAKTNAISILCSKAVALDPELGLSHYALGRLHSVFANLEIAKTHLQRVMALQPENEDARAYYGVILNFQGDAERALEILEPAVASHPNPPYWYYLCRGTALFSLGNTKQQNRHWMPVSNWMQSRHIVCCFRFLFLAKQVVWPPQSPPRETSRRGALILRLKRS